MVYVCCYTRNVVEMLCPNWYSEHRHRPMLPMEKMVAQGIPMYERQCDACGVPYPIFKYLSTPSQLCAEAGNGLMGPEVPKPNPTLDSSTCVVLETEGSLANMNSSEARPCCDEFGSNK